MDAEPLADAHCYGGDRQFAYLRLAGEDSETDTLSVELEHADHPVIRYELEDVNALGSEFYRWEFGVATAAALMGVHPFNQPDVDRAKQLTRRALESSESAESVFSESSEGSVRGLLSSMRAGDYLAILAYVPQTPENDDALAQLRSKILHKYRVPTTLGYGPRYLHSTGQLHKGGPDTVAALMIVSPHEEEIAIPGEDFAFGALADAQAAADIQALREAGRRVAMVRLSKSDVWIQENLVASQSFRPRRIDDKLLSVYDGDQITPEAAWFHYTKGP